MILQETTNTLESFGTTEASNFKMQQSRRAFQILSDLYSDKPLAIVRELGCNSRDSMVAAGKSDQPFLIHLPNTLEPWLTIQDFGTGISHKDIYDIYAVYFASTKTESNSQIGCMGLGSKAGFCYTDNFTVTSTVDGTQRIYSAYFDEKNMPTIALMSTTETTEGNGVAIQIPIKAGDYNNFYNAVKKAFRFFEVKPIVTGQVMNWHEDKPTFSGTGWKSFEGFGYNESFAVMGGVTYPIKADNINLNYEDRSFLVQAGIVMYFEMGELDFVPSREALSYCPQTIQALTEKLEFIKKNFCENYQKNIADKENIWDALLAVNKLNSQFAFLATAFKVSKLSWNGIDISSPQKYFTDLLKGKYPLNVRLRKGYTRNRYSIGRWSISLETDITLYEDDLNGKGTEGRAKFYVYQNPDAKLMIFDSATVSDLIGAGFPDTFIKVSTLPKVIRNKTVNVGGGKRQGMKVYAYGTGYMKVWDSTDYDPTIMIPEYYIAKETAGWDFNCSSDKIRCTTKNHVFSICRFLGISLDAVVLVSERNVKTLVKDGSKSFKDLIADIKIVIDPDDYFTAEAYNYHIDNIGTRAAFKELDNANPFKVFINQVIQARKNYNKYQEISGLLKSAHPDFSKGNKVIFKSECPILTLVADKIGHYGWEDDDIIKIVSELEKKSLTIPQTSCTI